jgi:hypothetical protein
LSTLIFPMRKSVLFKLLLFFTISMLLWSRKTVQGVSEIPSDTYWIPARQYPYNGASTAGYSDQRKIAAEISQQDSILEIAPLSPELKPLRIGMKSLNNLQIYRYTFDVDILTIPFKVTPSKSGFPEQLNANFSATSYLGGRKDLYRVKITGTKRKKTFKISGTGFGYGGFFGLGTVTMKPFVTQRRIDYKYDGMVVNVGLQAFTMQRSLTSDGLPEPIFCSTKIGIIGCIRANRGLGSSSGST